jgi:hypothetical protein
MGRFLRIVAVVAGVLSGVSQPPAVGAESKSFGVTAFSLRTTRSVERVEGIARILENVPTRFFQAGGHPDGQSGSADSLTGVVRFASEPTEAGLNFAPTRDVKDVVVSLPPGLVGDPMAVPRCSLTQLLGTGEHCPADTQIGVARVQLGTTELLGPVVNVTPESGQSAEFGIENMERLVFLETAHLVRTAQGYGFTLVSKDIPLAGVTEVEQTIWGVPGDPIHDPQRGLFCQQDGIGSPLCLQNDKERKAPGSGGLPFGLEPVPFLTMPTDCAAGHETGELRADSWEEPGVLRENQKYEGYVERAAEESLPTLAAGGFTGCDLLKFEPGIEVRPETLLADEPVELGVNIEVPQTERPEANATPHLRKAIVTLPEGMSISPGVVDGIQACDESGPQGINFTGPESEEVDLNGELQLAPGHCPDASTLGTVEAITPLLPAPVKGHVYLARPGCGGPGERACTEQDVLDGNLYKLYLEFGGTGEFAKAGIQIKVRADVQVNPATGQLTTIVEENPQTPFSEVRIRLNGGPRSPIDDPATCGRADTTTDFTPWSGPGRTPEGVLMPGTPDATPSSFVEVFGCSDPSGLAPSFLAGVVTPQSGQFSSFTLDLARQDREQYVTGVQLHTPPGLLAMLSSVPLCGEADANAGACPEASKVGTTRVASGAGSHPFEIEGGIYLTGPYAGAPFGLSIVTHVVAGPFNLGVVVVRARIDIDRSGSTATITTDEGGPHAIPQIVFGVPVRLRRLTVDIDRPGFMLNPTNCSEQRVTADIVGSQGAVARVSSPFAVGGCRGLAFKPVFAASTKGRTSRSRGASLDTRLRYPPGALGNDANIASVKVSLPKQLPSRLNTLQKACPAATFEADPAACPRTSIVGIVRATTPVLPVGLIGPVYFVSHGGEAFPSLILVLQGDGVRVDLVGTTFISKRGMTSSTFKSVPDVPVDTFELFLPQGPYSALAANGDLCKVGGIVTVRRRIARRVRGRLVRRTVAVREPRPGGLLMPTEFVAQNGLVFRQNTRIAVNGCRAVAAGVRRGGGR